MIITIDTEDIAKTLIDWRGYTKEDFKDGNWPDGWTNDFVDTIGSVEDAVFEEVQKILNK